jgi:alpha-beta hydrolase superfamily lysophospholipase
MTVVDVLLQGRGKAPQYSGSWVEAMNKDGWFVAGFDMQSCGHSDGIAQYRNYFESFDDLVDDALQLSKCVQSASGWTQGT